MINPGLPLEKISGQPVLTSDLLGNRVVRRLLHQTQIRQWNVSIDNIRTSERDEVISEFNSVFVLQTEDGPVNVIMLGDTLSFSSIGSDTWSTQFTAEEVI